MCSQHKKRTPDAERVSWKGGLWGSRAEKQPPQHMDIVSVEHSYVNSQKIDGCLQGRTDACRVGRTLAGSDGRMQGRTDACRCHQ